MCHLVRGIVHQCTSAVFSTPVCQLKLKGQCAPVCHLVRGIVRQFAHYPCSEGQWVRTIPLTVPVSVKGSVYTVQYTVNVLEGLCASVHHLVLVLLGSQCVRVLVYSNVPVSVKRSACTVPVLEGQCAPLCQSVIKGECAQWKSTAVLEADH